MGKSSAEKYAAMSRQKLSDSGCSRCDIAALLRRPSRKFQQLVVEVPAGLPAMRGGVLGIDGAPSRLPWQAVQGEAVGEIGGTGRRIGRRRVQ